MLDHSQRMRIHVVRGEPLISKNTLPVLRLSTRKISLLLFISLIAALTILSESSVISNGSKRMQEAIDSRIRRACIGDKTVPDTLAREGGGLGGARVRAFDVTNNQLEAMLGTYMFKKVRRAWSVKERGPGVASNGYLVVSGLQLGNIWITVQPLLGVEGDPMRLLFQRDLTPHPQYCAAYELMKRQELLGGIGAQAVIHFGMHGTVEWLPGQSLGNDRVSWSDQLLGSLPNLYLYCANNPSESILAKRRGYATVISYNVPPYGRAGLYLELSNLKELVNEYRSMSKSDVNNKMILRDAIWSSCQRCGIDNDVPLPTTESCHPTSQSPDLLSHVSDESFDGWILQVSNYLMELQDRFFSSGLHTLGVEPNDEEKKSYLQAYYGDRMNFDDCIKVMQQSRLIKNSDSENSFTYWIKGVQRWFHHITGTSAPERTEGKSLLYHEAIKIVDLLDRNTEEIDNLIVALDGGYVPPAPGGDLLRDGTTLLPTGRNIHALDPYRMPSAVAWEKGMSALSFADLISLELLFEIYIASNQVNK